MKRKELLKRLKAKGAFFCRSGANHDVYKSRSGAYITVPRHNDIKEPTAWEILKQAD